MTRVFLSCAVGLLMALTLNCGGSSADLHGLSIGEIELEGEHAEDVQADLQSALESAGAMVNQPGAPRLVGTLTWEWAGEGEEPYPTLVKIFMQSDPEDRKFTVSSQYAVPSGAQPQSVEHYRGQIVERIVSRLAAQNREAS